MSLSELIPHWYHLIPAMRLYAHFKRLIVDGFMGSREQVIMIFL